MPCGKCHFCGSQLPVEQIQPRELSGRGGVTPRPSAGKSWATNNLYGVEVRVRGACAIAHSKEDEMEGRVVIGGNSTKNIARKQEGNGCGCRDDSQGGQRNKDPGWRSTGPRAEEFLAQPDMLSWIHAGLPIPRPHSRLPVCRAPRLLP